MRIPLLVLIIAFAISITGLTLIEGMDDKGNPYRMNFFDAFYFVSYMASTIGFGEAPYTFTYPQRLWVSFCIYLTVIGWFYGIGTIVALIQDKTLIEELVRAAFKKSIKNISGKYVLVLGYNNVTKEIIERLNGQEHRIVVIDKEENKINALDLEGHHPSIPTLKGDVTQIETLKFAGIESEKCGWVVSLLDDETKNVKIALMCKILNPKVSMIVKATNEEYVEYLANMGVKNIINPFKIISKRIYLAHTSPHLWMLERWVFTGKLNLNDKNLKPFPKGKYIICSSGRMGEAIKEGLEKAAVPYTLLTVKTSKNGVFGDKEDMEFLEKNGIKEASAIIAATKNDFINLMILKTAKKLNPSIFTIARENTLDDISIFEAAEIDRNYILEEVLIEKTYNFIAKPLANLFVQKMMKESEEWGEALFNKLLETVGENPQLFELKIDKNHAFALTNYLREGKPVRYEVLLRDRADWKERAKIVILLLKRKEKVILKPNPLREIKEGDEILVAATKESFNDLEYIVENFYEFHYVLNGKEKLISVFKYLYPEEAA